jgi:hypothetical protein
LQIQILEYCKKGIRTHSCITDALILLITLPIYTGIQISSANTEEHFSNKSKYPEISPLKCHTMKMETKTQFLAINMNSELHYGTGQAL